ncbi:DUF3955 domain-containing protein [Litorilituus sediminis]|uniref:DUF3955 domain-containing protein n=1 Tax=Litorilituus sediminis TaxID=718192 RepID=A0A4P6P845_9GAMM|nr:DUF3955 domain-containing protein [Litorilituus sediminis]
MLKKIWPSVFCFTASLLAYFSYHIIGVSIDKDGYLREPFFLIPTSMLFAVLGTMLLLYYLYSNKLK